MLLEDEQAEDREHDVGRPGDDLDARLDGAREPAGRPYSTSHTAIATPIGSGDRGSRSTSAGTCR